MTKQEILDAIKVACKFYIDSKFSDFFCGMTNNTARRMKEHGVNGFVYTIQLKQKSYANDLLTELSNLGFDTGNQIGSGQDDSVWLYVYYKTSNTVESLRNSFTLAFDGEWYNKVGLALLNSSEGIYACFACGKDLDSENRYNCKKLIYIGMTEKQGFHDRIKQHFDNDHASWGKYYDPKTEQLVYAIAPLDSDLLQTIESALIYENQPAANSEYKDHYQGEYDEVTVTCRGSYGALKRIITAKV